MRNFIRSLFARRFAFLFEGGAAVADGTAAAGSDGSKASGQPSSPTAGAAGKDGQSNTPTGADAAGKKDGQSQGFTYKEDRSKWIPPHRLKEENDGRTKAEKEVQRLTALNADQERRMRALAGLDPNAASDAETEKVKQAFFAMFPQYAKLTPELVDKMLTMVERGESLESAARYTYDRLATNTLRNLESRFLDAIGADEITDRQRDKLYGAFGALMKRDPEAFRQRYEAEDPTLLDEFIKEFTEDFFDPVRRLHAAGVVETRRPVPRGEGSRAVVTQPPKINYLNPDEVENYAVERMKEAGYLRER